MSYKEQILNLRQEGFTYDEICDRLGCSSGTNQLDNLGIVCPEVNAAKSSLTVEEFLNLCKAVLENNGYEVRSNKPIG